MTLSITMAEPGARDSSTQEGIWGPGETLTVWCLVFCCIESIVILVASKCQSFLQPTVDHPELPSSPCSLSHEGKVLCSPYHQGAWVPTLRNEHTLCLPAQETASGGLDLTIATHFFFLSLLSSSLDPTVGKS